MQERKITEKLIQSFHQNLIGEEKARQPWRSISEMSVLLQCMLVKNP